MINKTTINTTFNKPQIGFAEIHHYDITRMGNMPNDFDHYDYHDGGADWYNIYEGTDQVGGVIITNKGQNDRNLDRMALIRVLFSQQNVELHSDALFINPNSGHSLP